VVAGYEKEIGGSPERH
jgi:hypothetical protein